MHYVHQSQLSELSNLPETDAGPVHFWTGNVKHLISARTTSEWSVLESSGALVGEFVEGPDGFAVIDDEGVGQARFENWRSAVRNIVRRGLAVA